MLTMCFKSSKDNSRIIEFNYPEFEKDILEIMKDLRWNAEKNILAIQIVKSVNIPRPTINQALVKLLRLKWIERIGLGRATRYKKR